MCVGTGQKIHSFVTCVFFEIKVNIILKRDSIKHAHDRNMNGYSTKYSMFKNSDWKKKYWNEETRKSLLKYDNKRVSFKFICKFHVLDGRLL